ncbi:hypothetical protein BDP55DRAFT_653429 [Colletotrichum godetiae]|uniref:Secreted protein n=1 Tax=Colletotrichum godetiae TaxID=1209918 RepID=A0AAJ0ATV0_9PEZI|nr:uncharacterized protein BDP55DRAFT_653429 [Colletotrichum godetiae]KAK1689537.1 hypothetical protein BDP55DRAFT_653429 [Colletotrichum godetiae]
MLLPSLNFFYFFLFNLLRNSSWPRSLLASWDTRQVGTYLGFMLVPRYTSQATSLCGFSLSRIPRKTSNSQLRFHVFDCPPRYSSLMLVVIIRWDNVHQLLVPRSFDNFPNGKVR